MIAALVALLLFTPPACAPADTLHVTISVATEAAGAVANADGLQKGLSLLFGREFGRFAELSFASGAAPQPGDWTAAISIGIDAGAIRIDTDMGGAGATRSLSSTVPRGAPASLLSTMAGDLAFLLFASRGFSTLPLAPAPGLTGLLSTDSLGELTGWNPEDLEPIGLASSGENITVCFPHSWLTLGPGFRIVPQSIRDLHALSGGREQLQLSGLAVGTGDRLVLFSQASGKLVRENPRRGTRQLIDAPGLSALPGLLLDDGTLVALSGDENSPRLLLSSLSGPATSWRAVAGTYVSAFSRDREGNIWAWDAVERRIRVLTPAGTEVFSIKPLLPASTMQLPQQLAVLDDGSFLLAGSGEIWRFENTGIPVWRLTRIPGRPGEQLPASFFVAANGTTGDFTILDEQSRRLIAFSAGPTAAGLPALLGRLDGRRQADLQAAADAAQDDGLSLMAWQLGDQIARLGGPESERAAAHIAVLREKAMLYAQYADALARDLLYSRADIAYLRAGEASRELAAESPVDPDAPRLVQSVVARRLDVRSALARASDLRIDSATAQLQRNGGCAETLVLHLHVANTAAAPLMRVRLHLALPSLQPAPALAAVDELAPGAAEDLDVALGETEGAIDFTDTAASVFVTYDRGTEGISAAFSLPVQMAAAKAAGAASELGCRVLAGDPLLDAVSDDMTGVSGSADADRFRSFASTYEAVSIVRAQQVQPAASDHAVATGGIGPQSVRAILRGLSADRKDWALLAASLAASRGLDARLLSVGDGIFALVSTGMPISDAVARFPALAPLEPLLRKIAQDDMLWIPLDTAIEAGEADMLASAVRDAARALASVDVRAADVWQSASASTGAPPVPVPFPLVFPPVAMPTDDPFAEIVDGLRESLPQ